MNAAPATSDSPPPLPVQPLAAPQAGVASPALPPEGVVRAMVGQDERHLRWLAAVHRATGMLAVVMGGALVCGVTFRIPLVEPFFQMSVGPTADGSTGAEAMAGAMWTGLRVAGGLALGVLGWLMLRVGRALAARHGLDFCRVIAGVLCVTSPLGLLVGLFTLAVLARPGVKWLFRPQGPADLR